MSFVYLGPIGLGNGSHFLGNGPHVVGDNVASGILSFVLISLGIMSFGISVDCQWIIQS